MNECEEKEYRDKLFKKFRILKEFSTSRKNYFYSPQKKFLGIWFYSSLNYYGSNFTLSFSTREECEKEINDYIEVAISKKQKYFFNVRKREEITNVREE